GIDDDALAQSASFGFSDADHFEQSTFTSLTRDTRHLTRPYVETNRVLRAFCHLRRELLVLTFSYCVVAGYKPHDRSFALREIDITNQRPARRLALSIKHGQRLAQTCT